MNPPPSPYTEVSIDVSKDKLDVAFAGRLSSFPNDAKGIRSLLSRFEDPEGAFRLSCEATGPYSRLLVACCLLVQAPEGIVLWISVNFVDRGKASLWFPMFSGDRWGNPGFLDGTEFGKS